MSRTFEDTETKVVDKKFCFACKIVDLDLKLVKTEQERDPDILLIIGDKMTDERLRPDFEIMNGITYKRANHKEEVSRLYIPKTLVNEVLTLKFLLGNVMCITYIKEMQMSLHHWNDIQQNYILFK